MGLSNYRDFYKATDDLGEERQVSVCLSRIYRMIPDLSPNIILWNVKKDPNQTKAHYLWK